MTKNLIQYLSGAALVAGSLAAVGCGSANTPATGAKASPTKPIASQRAGDLVVSLQSQSGELVQGQNRFVIAFRSATNNQPVDVGKVSVGSSMAMPGMAPMVAPIELQPAGETGTYALTGDFSMSGAWKFEVRWEGPGGQGTTSFSTNVR
ncbi:MAG: FixH family protein [Bryobacteraceae bacterium]